MGEDPRHVPMRVFPGMHYSMGGLWVDYDQMTNVPGLFAAGECEYQYHGANRLGANSLLSCIHGGLKAADRILRHIRSQPVPEAPAAIFDDQVRSNEKRNEALLTSNGPEHPFQIHTVLGEWMTENVTVVRKNESLERTVDKISELKDRFRRVGINDRGSWANQVLVFARNLENMLDLAHVMTAGALARNESRGAHYKPEFPDRDDKNWLKTTLAAYSPDGPKLSYEAVDVSLIPPRPRKYDIDKKA